MTALSLPIPERYRVVERIGAGGMGEVYRAVDRQLGRTVAIKLLPPHRSEPGHQLRLLREAQAASALSHPGIVTVYDIGSAEGRVFIILEYVEGERLSDLARRGISWREAATVCAAAAEALAAAHAAGILHRDVKSANILRTRDGRIKILDFGLAKLRGELLQRVSAAALPSGDEGASKLAGDVALDTTLSSSTDPLGETMLASSVDDPTLTPAGAILGTPAYMAPELLVGGEIDERAEVFSLGVVLYELLTDRRPFDRADVRQTLRAIREETPTPPHMAAPGHERFPMVSPDGRYVVYTVTSGEGGRGGRLHRREGGRRTDRAGPRLGHGVVDAGRRRAAGATGRRHRPDHAHRRPPRGDTARQRAARDDGEGGRRVQRRRGLRDLAPICADLGGGARSHHARRLRPSAARGRVERGPPDAIPRTGPPRR